MSLGREPYRRRSTRPTQRFHEPEPESPPSDMETEDNEGRGLVGYIRSMFSLGGNQDSEDDMDYMASEEPPRRRRTTQTPGGGAIPHPAPSGYNVPVGNGGPGRSARTSHQPPRANGPGGGVGAPFLDGGYLGNMDAAAIIESTEPAIISSNLLAKELEYETEDYFGPPQAAESTLSPITIPALEPHLSMLDILRLFPLDKMYQRMEGWHDDTHLQLSFQNPFALYSCPSAPNEIPHTGKMYFGSPHNPRQVSRRAIIQGGLLAWRLTSLSFMELTKTQLHLHPRKGLEFLLDAIVRVATNTKVYGSHLHTEARTGANQQAAELKRQFAGLTTLRPLPPLPPPTLADKTPMAPQTGPMAAAFRNSFGSMAYWGDIRAHMSASYRVCVRHAARMTYLATGALLSRINPTVLQSVLTREATFLGRAFDVLAMMAEQTIQWLSVVMEARLHPYLSHPTFLDLANEPLFLHLPLGSVGVAGATSEAIGDSAAQRLVANSGLNTILAATIFALQSTLNIVMQKHARAYRRIRNGNGVAGDPTQKYENIATQSMLAAGLILQRMLGLTDILVSCLSVVAIDGGSHAVDVGTYTPLRYACVLKITAPLYARTTPTQFWSSVKEACAKLQLSPVGTPQPEPQNYLDAVDFLTENIMQFPPRVLSTPSMLGPRVKVLDILPQFRRLLMGEEETAALRAHITGRRQTGSTNTTPSTTRK
ncbi:tegument protein VP13/14 [Macropodid alphaherpesvirus 2]|uniref:Tegument protein UL47 n=1 Tax=Macropodid alphaherpesvirus 2 TaxID=83440 RepID=A0AAE7MLQ7_9ALPH|nr:tegument protein VP13/14 [Macropodid alphaherpesvirus 2]QOD40204.1 tegument protein VP13/14 [Macropodid alphaherpesvirus 2]WGO49718.1 tegument protein VP13/14 [Macropodid alphaherpesvirus 2]